MKRAVAMTVAAAVIAVTVVTVIANRARAHRVAFRSLSSVMKQKKKNKL